MINILMFCPQFRPVVGGAERQAEKLAIALVKIGCKVTILTPRIDDSSPDKEEIEGVIIERFSLIDLSRKYSIPGVAIVNIPFILWQVFWTIRPRLKGVEALHCHIASLQTAGAALAGRTAGVPVLLKAAMADNRSDLGEIEKTGASGKLIAWIVKKSIPIWVATTVAVEEALIRAGVLPNKIFRIPNGVEIHSPYGKNKDINCVNRFLYLGRLSTNIQRDIPTLIKAFDNLAKSYSKIELALVGGGDLYEETQKIVSQCASKERIHLPGFDKPEKWLSWADCFVLPSRREGLSNSLLEAMAAGLPCIANDIQPNREVLANGASGILVAIEDKIELEEAMHSLIVSSKTAKDYSIKARNRVIQHYSIHAVAKKYKELYKKLQSR